MCATPWVSVTWSKDIVQISKFVPTSFEKYQMYVNNAFLYHYLISLLRFCLFTYIYICIFSWCRFFPFCHFLFPCLALNFPLWKTNITGGHKPRQVSCPLCSYHYFHIERLVLPLLNVIFSFSDGPDTFKRSNSACDRFLQVVMKVKFGYVKPLVYLTKHWLYTFCLEVCTVNMFTLYSLSLRWRWLCARHVFIAILHLLMLHKTENVTHWIHLCYHISMVCAVVYMENQSINQSITLPISVNIIATKQGK